MACCIFFWPMSLLTWSSSQDSGAQSWPSICQEVRCFAMTEQAESEVSNVGRDLLCEIVRDGEYAEAKKVSTPDMVWRHSALNQNFLLLSRTTPSRIQVAGEAMRGATHCFASNSDPRRRRAAIKPESFDGMEIRRDGAANIQKGGARGNPAVSSRQLSMDINFQTGRIL